MTGTGKARIEPDGKITYYHDEVEILYKCPSCGEGTVRTCIATEEHLHCFSCGARLVKIGEIRGYSCFNSCETFKRGNCPMPKNEDGLIEY